MPRKSHAHPWTKSPTQFMEISHQGLAHLRDSLQLGEDDLVFDIGSGLGRILSELLQHFPCKGVAVERNPSLARVAAERLRKFDERARVIVSDVRTVDLQEATAVVTYIPSVNLESLKKCFLSKIPLGCAFLTYAFAVPGWFPIRPATDGVFRYVIGSHTKKLMAEQKWPVPAVLKAEHDVGIKVAIAQEDQPYLHQTSLERHDDHRASRERKASQKYLLRSASQPALTRVKETSSTDAEPGSPLAPRFDATAIQQQFFPERPSDSQNCFELNESQEHACRLEAQPIAALVEEISSTDMELLCRLPWESDPIQHRGNVVSNDSQRHTHRSASHASLTLTSRFANGGNHDAGVETRKASWELPALGGKSRHNQSSMVRKRPVFGQIRSNLDQWTSYRQESDDCLALAIGTKLDIPFIANGNRFQQVSPKSYELDLQMQSEVKERTPVRKLTRCFNGKSFGIHPSIAHCQPLDFDAYGTFYDRFPAAVLDRPKKIEVIDDAGLSQVSDRRSPPITISSMGQLETSKHHASDATVSSTSQFENLLVCMDSVSELHAMKETRSCTSLRAMQSVEIATRQCQPEELRSAIRKVRRAEMEAREMVEKEEALVKQMESRLSRKASSTCVRSFSNLPMEDLRVRTSSGSRSLCDLQMEDLRRR